MQGSVADVIGDLLAAEAPAPGPEPSIRLCVAALVADPEGRVLLVRNRKRNAAAGEVWELPGGGMSAGETWEDALCREVREETGLEATPSGRIEAVLSGTPKPGAAFSSLIVVGRALADGEPKAGDDAVDARWWSTDALPALADLASSATLRTWALTRGRGAISAEQRDRLRSVVTPMCTDPSTQSAHYTGDHVAAFRREITPDAVLGLLDALVLADGQLADAKRWSSRAFDWYARRSGMRLAARDKAIAGALEALPVDILLAADGDLVQGIRGLEAAYQVERKAVADHAAEIARLRGELYRARYEGSEGM